MWPLGRDLNDGKKPAVHTNGRRILEIGRLGSANALRQKAAWLVLRQDRRPTRLKQAMMRGVLGDEAGEIVGLTFDSLCNGKWESHNLTYVFERSLCVLDAGRWVCRR